MRLGRKQPEDLPAVAAKAKRRVDRLPAAEVIQWADNAGAAVSRTISDYRKDGSVESLLEAREAILAMWGCFESLLERSDV